MTSTLDSHIQKLKKCEIISEDEVKELCRMAKEILMEESNIQRVDAPVIVISLLLDLRRHSWPVLRSTAAVPGGR